MAKLKKNAVNQILFTMVDKTDFATLETSLASDFTVKSFKVTHGSAAATVSTLSRIVSKVGSGFYRLSLEANACNCDFLGLRVAHASAATQMMIFEMEDQNTASIVKGMSDILSKAYLLNTSMSSDIISMLSTVSQLRVRTNWSTVSDLASKIVSHAWAANINGASMVSNIASAVWAHAVGNSAAGRISRIVSYASDIESTVNSQFAVVSNYLSNFSNYLSNASTIRSDIYSLLTAHNTKLTSEFAVVSNYLSNFSNYLSNASDILSNAYSAAAKGTSQAVALSDVASKIYARQESGYSDLKSAIAAGPAATIGVSDISLIAAAVWDEKYNAHSTASTIGSMIEVMASGVSNAYSMAVANSALISNTYSLVSDVYSALNVGATASDVASAVWAQHYAGHSVASSFGSAFEKIYSHTSNISDIASKIYARQASQYVVLNGSLLSGMSDILSKVYVQTTGGSDILSKVYAHTTGASDALSKVYARQASQYVVINGSMLSGLSDITSKIYARQSSEYSNVLSVALIAASVSSDIRSHFSDFVSAYYDTGGVKISNSALSDIRSAIAAGPAATVTDSDISNIASAVWANAIGSDVNSKVGKIASRVPAVLATSAYLSDVYSALSNQISGVTVTVDTASIASGVWAHAKATSTLAYTKVAASGASLVPGISDILSKVYVQTTAGSDVLSKIYAREASQFAVTSNYFSNISNFVSDILSTMGSQFAIVSNYLSNASNYLSNISGFVSNAYSAAAKGTSQAVALSDVASKIYARQASQYTKSYSAIQAGGLNASAISDIASAVWGAKWDTNSVASSFGSMFEGIQTAMTTLTSIVHDGYTDATSLVANSVRDRIRTQGWIIRNKMSYTKATGAVQLMKDDNLTEAFSVAAQVTSDATSVLRKRIE